MFKIKVRPRLTADGGKSIMASDCKVFTSTFQNAEIPFFDGAPLTARSQSNDTGSWRSSGITVKSGSMSSPGQANAPSSTFTPGPANIAKMAQALQRATKAIVDRYGAENAGSRADLIRVEAATALGLSRHFFTESYWLGESRKLITQEIKRH